MAKGHVAWCNAWVDSNVAALAHAHRYKRNCPQTLSPLFVALSAWIFDFSAPPYAREPCNQGPFREGTEHAFTKQFVFGGRAVPRRPPLQSTFLGDLFFAFCLVFSALPYTREPCNQEPFPKGTEHAVTRTVCFS